MMTDETTIERKDLEKTRLLCDVRCVMKKWQQVQSPSGVRTSL
jgi:hypothetical protein